MPFLNPIFALTGIALVAIPIVIHLLNRRRFKIVEWAAMQYLLAALKKNRRRLQLESLLLLLMRCAALLLLGLALARPVGCGNSAAAALAGNQVGLHVIVLDDSYSMAYQADRPEAHTHFDQAKRVAKGLIERLTPGSQQVAVVTASMPARVLVRPTFNQQSVAEAIDRLPQSFAGTDLVGATRLAQTLAGENAALPSKTLYLLSDCTTSALRGPKNEPLVTIGPDLAKQYRLVVYDFSRQNQSNIALTSLASSDLLVRVGFGSDLVARVQGFGSTSETRIDWKLNDRPLPGSGAIKPDAHTPPQVQSQAAFDAVGPALVRASVASGDKLPLDDVRTRVVDVAGDMKVLIVEGRRGVGALQGSASFLRLALAPPADPTQASKAPRYLAPTVISDLELPTAPLAENRVVILAGVGSIRPEVASALKAYVEQGGSLLLFMGDAVTADNYNQTLGAAGLLPGALVARVDSPATEQGFLFDFDPSNPHPILNVFKDQQKTGLESARVFSYWRVQLDTKANADRVLSYRASAPGVPADPAITVHNLGLGRVVFCTTSADAEWSTFVARQGAYVALMHELVAGAVGSGDAWLNLTVGDRVVIPPTLRLLASPVLIGPGDRSRPLEQKQLNAGSPRWTSEPITEPGVYTLQAGALKMPVAVNVPGGEADIRPVGPEGIKTALGEADLELHGDSLDPEALAKKDAADFAWPLLLVLLPLLFAESALAWKFGRSRK
ncbi:MAG: BatA domain-containing protein [Tepidisphaeraceae bacterium]